MERLLVFMARLSTMLLSTALFALACALATDHQTPGDYGAQQDAGLARGPTAPVQNGTATDAAPRAAYIQNRQIEAGAAYAFRGTEPGRFEAQNPAQRFRLSFIGSTVSVDAEEASWRVGLRLTGYGREGSVDAVAELQAVQHEGNRVSFQRGPDLVEWYVNGPLGLEQGMTLAARPAQPPTEGALALEVTFNGDLSPQFETGGNVVALVDSAGVRRASYGTLLVRDATGATLPARFEVERNIVRLIVDDHAAQYPIEVDPHVWVSEQRLVANDGQTSDYFGLSVSVSGDTALVGAYGDDDQGSGAGSAYVFVRSNGIWTQQQKLLPSDGAAGHSFGWSVSLDGDTALVGAPSDDDSGSSSGSAYVFVRSAGVWTQQQKLLPNGGGAEDRFGTTVSVDAV
jgi:hypothetical protein